jgi:hypothetical protein
LNTLLEVVSTFVFAIPQSVIDVTELFPTQARSFVVPPLPVPVTGLVSAFCLPLKVDQSEADRYPSVDDVAALAATASDGVVY